MTDQLEKEPEIDDAPELEPIEEVEQDESSDEPDETEASEESVVTFGDDEPEQDDRLPSMLRKKLREEQKKTRELQKKLDQGKAEEPTALGAAPTMEDFDFDETEYRTALTDWLADERKHKATAETVKTQQEADQRAYQDRMGEYGEGKSSFEADKFEEAENSVRDALSETQQGILVQAFGRGAAPLIMGLGSNDTRLKKLADIKDNVAFIVAATRLEGQMKVSQRKPKSSPEARVIGSGGANTGDTNLEKLEAEADKTGDRSKIQAYKRQLKKAS